MKATTTQPAPVACVWWSVSRCAWGCQIGNHQSWHYNERDAIAHGKRLTATVRPGSCIAGDWA